MDMNANKCDVFICYRRKLASHAASRLRDRLAQALPDHHIFLDTEEIKHGDKYPVQLNKNLHQCCVLIVLIDQEWGKFWSSFDSNNKVNWIEKEIKTALDREIKIFTLLLDDARFPAKESLPESIRAFHDLHYYEIRG